MRSAVRTVLLVTASVLGASAASAASDIQETTSSGTASLSWLTHKPIPGPTSPVLGSSTLGVTVGADLDPVDAVKPILAVDMPKGVVVQAQWHDTKAFELVLTDDGANDATVKSEFTIAPHVVLFINAFGFALTYDYSAAALLPAIPGSHWTYDGKASQAFAPWGFDPAILNVPAPALMDAQLFSIPFPTITGSPALGGTLAVNATTAPTFNYTTKSVALMNMAPITTKGGNVAIPMVDADFLDVPATVLGEIAYTGGLLVRPSVTITSIGSFTLPFALTLDLPVAGTNVPYDSGKNPISVDFPKASFHIPLPNVKVADVTLDLGSVQIGETADKQAKIDNTGEMAGAMVFTSSDPQFVVVSTKEAVAAKGSYALDVKFTPAKDGPQAADITVTSNDPDQPVQTIHVTGNGTKIAESPASSEPAAPDAPKGPSGCGSRAAPTSGDVAGWAAVSVLVGAVLRRRQRNVKAAARR
jgi:MYXO-CTERM domain-containing protein